MENDQKSSTKKGGLSVLQLRNLAEVISRMRLSGLLGMSFQGNRDLYSVLGYKKELIFQDYLLTYRRGSLGKRVIAAPVDATWFGDVSVYENQEEEETEFEKKWKELNKKHHIIAKLNRFDKLIGLGEYAVLLMGFNDGRTLQDPLVGRPSELIYLQPYHQGNCQIVEWEVDEKNPRYGRPNIYTVKLIRPGIVGEYKESRVHWSRVIHAAGECLENDVLGSPRMESCFNRLSDIDKLAGGSAEMFWQGALGGKAFSTKEGATLDTQTANAMGEEIDEYIHGLRRYMRLQNMDVQNLSPDLVSSPKEYLDIQLDLLAGDTGIPKRILVGSERGELASTQDESNWLTRIEQRRIQFAEPFIMRPFIDRLIEVGILPEPQDGYQVDWPDLWSMSDQEQATVSKTRTETIATYVNAPGIESVIPEEFFLEELVGLSREQIERIEKILEQNPPEEPVGTQIERQRLEDMRNPPPPQQPTGGLPRRNEEFDVDAFIKRVVGNFNPNHGDDGRFSSGSGTGGSLDFGPDSGFEWVDRNQAVVSASVMFRNYTHFETVRQACESSISDPSRGTYAGDPNNLSRMGFSRFVNDVGKNLVRTDDAYLDKDGEYRRKPTTSIEKFKNWLINIIDNFNPFHDSQGRFATGPGGGVMSDDDAKVLAKERGYTVPPAWTNVRVASDPNADLQVIGEDTKGRKQYIYSAEATNRAAAEKFNRVKQFSKALPGIKQRIQSDFDSSDEAKVLHLISKTGFRIGSDADTGANTKAYGATTLDSTHVRVRGNVVEFDFTGKKGVQQVHTLEDPQLANHFRNKSGRLFNTNEDKVREYLQNIAPGFKVKDFRTHLATGEAIRQIKKMPKPTTKREVQRAINSVAEHVSKILGNTPTMAKNSYINPTVWAQWSLL